ncbi:MAG: hypothetical protein WD042_15570 [Phycisphaeraceae bacterium]
MGLETVELLMRIEDRFGVSIPDERASRIVTVKDMQDEVVRQLATRGQLDTPQLREEVLAGIIAITAKQMAMDPNLIKPESTWVGDITKYG